MGFDIEARLCYDVMVTYLMLLFSLAQHDNTLHLLFPHHPPEIINSVWEGPLSRYVGSLLPITLNNTGNLIAALAFILWFRYSQFTHIGKGSIEELAKGELIMGKDENNTRKISRLGSMSFCMFALH